MEYKLKKTDSGTDWEAYQVIKSDTARWVEDDCQEINNSSEWHKNISKIYGAKSSDTYCKYCGSKLKSEGGK